MISTFNDLEILINVDILISCVPFMLDYGKRGIVLKEEPIENLLDIISKTSNVKYKITKVNQTYEVTVSK